MFQAHGTASYKNQLVLNKPTIYFILLGEQHQKALVKGLQALWNSCR